MKYWIFVLWFTGAEPVEVLNATAADCERARVTWGGGMLKPLASRCEYRLPVEVKT